MNRVFFGVHSPLPRGGHPAAIRCAGVPRPEETPTPLGSPQVPRHRATVGSYGGGGSCERDTPAEVVMNGADLPEGTPTAERSKNTQASQGRILALA